MNSNKESFKSFKISENVLTADLKYVIVDTNIKLIGTTRGCTGFDGLTEDGEAVRGRKPR